MRLLDFIGILLTLAGGFGYVNYRFLRLPPTIGLTALTLAASLAAVAAEFVYPGVQQRAAAFVDQIDFGQAVLQGMLGFLLFAGALHLNLGDLGHQKAVIAVLATLGTVVAALIVSGFTWCLLAVLGLPIGFSPCLLFGALIAPTDPVAVLALVKRLGAPRALEVTIAGESLFNDGVGVALFLGLLEAAVDGQGLNLGSFGILFMREAAGGIAFGLAAGYLVYRLVKTVRGYYQLEVLLSLALVAGGYALADALHLSGPLAMVVAGLLIGNPGRQFAMSPTTVEHLDTFWELVDEILNAVLFVLLGLEVLAIRFTADYFLAGLLAVPVVLAARLASVGLVAWLLRPWQRTSRGTVQVLTWGGLRGALSVAMALSLPRTMPERELILAMTYVVVVFSILVQGLTIGPLTCRWLATATVVPAGPPTPPRASEVPQTDHA